MKVHEWKVRTSVALAASTLLFITTPVRANAVCPVGDDYQNKEKLEQLREQIEKNNQNNQCKERIEEIKILLSAISLSEHGFHSKAQEELITAIKKNPKLKIPQEIKYLSNADPNIFAGLELLFSQILSKFNLQLPISIWSILIYLAAIWVFIKAIERYQKIYLDIKDFNDDALELKIGKGTTGILKSLLLKTAEMGETSKPDIALGPIGKFESTIELKQLSLPLQLLNTFFPVRSFNLSGYCQQSSKKGLGLTLVLNFPNGTTKTKSFWQQKYAPLLSISRKEIEDKSQSQDLSQILARAAASWILFELDKESFNKWLGFDNWESYAFSKTGEYWLEKNNDSQAEEMMNRSLLYYPHNRFSLFNLGVLKFRQSLQSQNSTVLLSESKSFLEKAQEIINNQNTLLKLPFPPTDPVWYKTLYQLSQVEEYSLIKNKNVSRKNCDETFYAKTLVEAIEICLSKRCDLFKKQYFQSLREFMNEFLAISKTAYATCLVRDAQPNDNQEKLIKADKEIIYVETKYIMAFADRHKSIAIDEKGGLLLFGGKGELKLPEPKKAGMLPLAGYYNLACYYAALAEVHKSNEVESDRLTHQASTYLKYVFNQDKNQKEWAKKDPSLEWLLKKYPLLTA